MAYFYFKNNYLQKACNTESDKNKLAPQKEANGWIEKDVSEDQFHAAELCTTFFTLNENSDVVEEANTNITTDSDAMERERQQMVTAIDGYLENTEDSDWQAYKESLLDFVIPADLTYPYQGNLVKLLRENGISDAPSLLRLP